MQLSEDMMRGMTRGELAKRTGIHPETVRYYQQNALIAPAQHTDAGYRLFDEEAARRVAFIKRAQAAGFTLAEIKDLLAIQSSPHGTSGAVREMVNVKLGDIEARIHALTTMRNALLHLVDDCPGGDAPTSACPILHSFDAVGADPSACP
jgi:MerR family Zn(II)-responsive transcriptional regulator of zntA